MRKSVLRGLVMVLVGLLLLGVGYGSPVSVVKAGSNNTDIDVDDDDIKVAVADLKAYLIRLQPTDAQKKQLDKILAAAFGQIGYTPADGGSTSSDKYEKGKCKYTSITELNAYVETVKSQMQKAVTPSSSNDDDDDDDGTPVSADHLLMVGGNWTTPVANAGQAVSIVLPVVNMGKTMVTDAVVTPALSTDSAVWPFEITSSNYSQVIKDLPGTDTGASDMDRRREVTWNLMTRSDVGSGYQKISFSVNYRASDGTSQTATLDTYIQVNGTAGVGKDGQTSVPRVIITGFDTVPETVHAGETFVLTLHLKNTSTATSVNNMICEVVAAQQGKDEETTYEAFLPTAGSSTIFIDKIAKNGTKDISLEMEAKADLAQKPYAVDVNMSYEDEKVNAYTNTNSVSIPVKQESRVEVSEPEVMPSSIEIGSESNVMFNIYNMGKTKLYNVQVKTEGETVSGGDAFIGNLDSGATGSVDIYLMGQTATMDEGIIKLLISYEDETGAPTTVEKEITLFVTEPVYDEMGMDGMMEGEDMMEEGGGSGKIIAIVVVVLLAAAGVAVFIIRKRKKKKAQQLLEEELMDLDEDDES